MLPSSFSVLVIYHCLPLFILTFLSWPVIMHLTSFPLCFSLTHSRFLLSHSFLCSTPLPNRLLLHFSFFPYPVVPSFLIPSSCIWKPFHSTFSFFTPNTFASLSILSSSSLHPPHPPTFPPVLSPFSFCHYAFQILSNFRFPPPIPSRKISFPHTLRTTNSLTP